MSLQIYTDGSCHTSKRIGGYAFAIIKDDKVLETVFGSEDNTTNNRMEMKAVILSFQYLEENNLLHYSIQIYTDSKYICEGINKYICRWMNNNWQSSNKTQIKNQDLWQQIHLISKKVSILWVKGHDVNQYNKLVDKLAQQAMKRLLLALVKH